MLFDMTNVSDQGFTVLPPDRYAVVTTDEWWLRKKEETGNMIVDVDVDVTAGKYQGETTRYFHTITNDDRTLGFLLRFLRALSVVRDGDRKSDGQLKVEFLYGDKDDRGRARIKAIKVNNEERPVAGYKAIAVITERQNPETGEKQSNIARFEMVDQEAPAGAPAQGGAQSPGASRGNIPF